MTRINSLFIKMMDPLLILLIMVVSIYGTLELDPRWVIINVMAVQINIGLFFPTPFKVKPLEIVV